MSEQVKAFYQDWAKKTETLKKLAPQLMTGFGGLFQKVMGDGVLTAKQKELIALAIAVAVKCRQCILLHVKKSLDAGATKEEILEAAQVAVVMGGGPAFTHMG
jgi:AhpD family alkylhydroperoxidase